jgi:hypothetical protein
MRRQSDDISFSYPCDVVDTEHTLNRSKSFRVLQESWIASISLSLCDHCTQGKRMKTHYGLANGTMHGLLMHFFFYLSCHRRNHLDTLEKLEM